MAVAEEDKNATRFALSTVDLLAEIEGVAEEILSDRQQVVELDRKRNSNREALRILKKTPSQKQVEKSWVCFGDMFIKFPNSSVQDMIEQDQKNLDKEIVQLRNNLKPKVSKLHELEGQPGVKGFDLLAMSQEDLSMFHS